MFFSDSAHLFAKALVQVVGAFMGCFMSLAVFYKASAPRTGEKAMKPRQIFSAALEGIHSESKKRLKTGLKNESKDAVNETTVLSSPGMTWET